MGLTKKYLKFEKHIDVTGPHGPQNFTKIVDILVSETELSKATVKQAMHKGAVWVTSSRGTDRVRRADRVANTGEKIHLYYDEGVLAEEPEPAVLIADEGSYSVWHKPYGMLCQGSKWGDHCTINRWVETHHQPQKSVFIVHRLDRAASGLIVLAHKKKTAAYFSRLFQDRDIEKCYQAIVEGQFPETLAFNSEVDGKPALTEAKLVNYDADLNRSSLRVKIDTGRKHQIRRHLSEAGYPIIGDRLYGNVESEDAENLCLVSCYLAFCCPEDQQRKEFVLPE